MRHGEKLESENFVNREAVSKILVDAHGFCTSIDSEDAREIINEGDGFGELIKDTEIKADRRLGLFFLDSFTEHFSSLPFTIDVEGLGEKNINTKENEDSLFYVTVDPLDGSLNLKTRGLTKGLPYSSCVSIFEKTGPKFENCLVGGVIDLRNGDLWVAEKGKGCFINGESAKTSGQQKVDLKNGIIIGEFYYPENRQVLMKVFGEDKGWLRNPGSAAYEMSLVASGQADAYICDRQKSHELGAAYRMVTEAGGFVCDFDGNELNDRDYIFNSQIPVILAASEELAQEILHRLE